MQHIKKGGKRCLKTSVSGAIDKKKTITGGL